MQALPTDNTILIVAGTRPEAIKLAFVIRALKDFDVRLIATGQHLELFDAALRDAGLKPDISLDLMRPGQDPATFLARTAPQLAAAMAKIQPALVLVQGDTATAYAGALAAHRLGFPIAHVEAGLRTSRIDDPFPEELFRRAIARLATLHFAPTERAAAALLRENIKPCNIHVTGNTGIDHLFDAIKAVAPARSLPSDLNISSPFAIATVHRRENRGARLRSIGLGLERTATMLNLPIILPLHPAPELQPLRALLSGNKWISVIAPLDHASMVHLQANASLVLTDSGGLQEEAVTLGTPVVILRDETERQEAVLAGRACLAGADPDRISESAAKLLLAGRFPPSSLFGDGKAGSRIANLIADWLNGLTGTPARARLQ